MKPKKKERKVIKDAKKKERKVIKDTKPENKTAKINYFMTGHNFMIN